MTLTVQVAVGSTDAAPLEHYRPVLRYDGDERRFATGVDAFAASAGLERERGRDIRSPEPGFLGARYRDSRAATDGDRLVLAGRPRPGPPVVYGRAARDGEGRRWLQYWLFFADNTQDRGIVRTGRHTGDWEMLQIRLDVGGRPAEVVFAQHTWAERCSWNEVEQEGAAPVAYVANGSHALYPRPGRHDRPFPDPNDEADGRGPDSRPPLERVTERTPRWVAWPGRWGESEASVVPGEQSSPRGPAFQPERWSDPGRFADEQARPCGAGPPGRAWQMALAVAIGTVLLAAALLALRLTQSTKRAPPSAPRSRPPGAPPS